MEKVMVLLTFAVAMLSLLPNVKGAETANSKAVDKSKEIQQSMYAILRTMALPDAGNDRSVPVTQRFVLQVSCIITWYIIRFIKKLRLGAADWIEWLLLHYNYVKTTGLSKYVDLYAT